MLSLRCICSQGVELPLGASSGGEQATGIAFGEKQVWKALPLQQKIEGKEDMMANQHKTEREGREGEGGSEQGPKMHVDEAPQTLYLS